MHLAVVAAPIILTAQVLTLYRTSRMWTLYGCFLVNVYTRWIVISIHSDEFLYNNYALRDFRLPI